MSVAVQSIPTLNGVNGASKKLKSKNQLRRQKAKQKKAAAERVRGCSFNIHSSPHTNAGLKEESNGHPTSKVVIKTEEDHQQESENVEYVSEQLDLKGAALEAFSEVFSRFQFDPEDTPVRSQSIFLTLGHLISHTGEIRGPVQRRGHLLGRRNRWRDRL
jgi:splicing factor 3B subunit 2